MAERELDPFGRPLSDGAGLAELIPPDRLEAALAAARAWREETPDELYRQLSEAQDARIAELDDEAAGDDLSDLGDVEALFGPEGEASDEFVESDHPRAPDGKFGNKGSAAAGSGGGVGPSAEEKIANAATMYGAGSKQHQEAVRRFGGQKEPAAKPGGAGKYRPGLHAHGIAWATAQKNEWRKTAPDTIEAVMAAAPRNQAALAKACEAAAAAVGVPFKNPGPKRPERLMDKVKRGKTPQQINDSARGGFDARTPEESDAIVRRLAEHFELADEGWQKTPTGYFDRKVMVRFEDGSIGEVQMWPPGMLAAKSGRGHELYERWQGLPEDSTEKGALQDEMAALFADVEAKLPAEWKSLFRKDPAKERRETSS